MQLQIRQNTKSKQRVHVSMHDTQNDIMHISITAWSCLCMYVGVYVGMYVVCKWYVSGMYMGRTRYVHGFSKQKLDTDSKVTKNLPGGETMGAVKV